jgi:hypothetical protein
MVLATLSQVKFASARSLPALPIASRKASSSKSLRIASCVGEELVSHATVHELRAQRSVGVLSPVNYNVTGSGQNVRDTIRTCAYGVLPRGKNRIDRLIDKGYFHPDTPR